MTNILGVLGISGKFTDYTSDEDFAVLEDSSGRIKILNNEVFNVHKFVTGTVLGLRGRVNDHGEFITTAFINSGIPEWETKITLERPLTSKWWDLFENIESRNFIAFVSGLEFGLENQEKVSIDLLLKFFEGDFGSI